MMDFTNIKKIYFIGIGGIGVSAIARIMKKRGFEVVGSDLKESEITKTLEKEGIEIFYQQKKEQIDSSIDLVVKTAAVKSNEETIKAEELNIKILLRGEFLSIIANQYNLIAVAGSHGKTTTSSLLTVALKNIREDVSFNIGGIVSNYGTNSDIKEDGIFVTEADESDGTFLKLLPYVAILNNLDPEHLDYYGNFENLKKAFYDFAYSSRVVVWNGDDKNLKSIFAETCSLNGYVKFISFGFDNSNNYRVKDIIENGFTTTFSVLKDGIPLRDTPFTIPMLGKHNVLNALAAIVAIDQNDLNPTDIDKVDFSNFTGTKRRFELIFKDKDREISYYDDYAHHPKEMNALFETILNDKYRTIILYQPHRYTRTRDSFNEIVEVLKKVPYLIILKEYAASEKVIEGATAFDIFQKLDSNNHRELFFAKTIESAKEKILSLVKDKDIVFSVGAGNLNQVLYDIKSNFKN